MKYQDSCSFFGEGSGEKDKKDILLFYLDCISVIVTGHVSFDNTPGKTQWSRLRRKNNERSKDIWLVHSKCCFESFRTGTGDFIRSYMLHRYSFTCSGDCRCGCFMEI